jgi:CRP-like cAMP-binding protein
MGIIGNGQTFLDALDVIDRGALLALGSSKSYAAQETVLLEGDTGDFVVAIIDGWATVSSSSRYGQRVILALRGSGDLVGDLSVLDPNPRSATVTALGPMQGVEVSGDAFRGFIADRPRVTALVIKHLGSRLRASDGERMSLATETVLQRLAAYLGELVEHVGVPGRSGVALELQLRQHDLAAAVGATREAVAKALRILRDHNVITTGPLSIVVHNPGMLRAISSGRIRPSAG